MPSTSSLRPAQLFTLLSGFTTIGGAALDAFDTKNPILDGFAASFNILSGVFTLLGVFTYCHATWRWMHSRRGDEENQLETDVAIGNGDNSGQSHRLVCIPSPERVVFPSDNICSHGQPSHNPDGIDNTPSECVAASALDVTSPVSLVESTSNTLRHDSTRPTVNVDHKTCDDVDAVWDRNSCRRFVLSMSFDIDDQYEQDWPRGTNGTGHSHLIHPGFRRELEKTKSDVDSVETVSTLNDCPPAKGSRPRLMRRGTI